MTTEITPNPGSEVCEIIAVPSSMSIPGPFAFRAMYLWFSATPDGRADVVAIRQREAGSVPSSEAQRLLSSRDSLAFDETPQRSKALEDLCGELAADGWKCFETGKHWYSRRFQRTRGAVSRS